MHDGGASPDGALPDAARSDGALPDAARSDGAAPDAAPPDAARSDGSAADLRTASDGAVVADLATVNDLAAGSGFITASQTSLYLDGNKFRFVGANRYDATSFPPNSGKFRCGSAYTDAQLDQLLSEL
jgi:hypothetical protein